MYSDLILMISKKSIWPIHGTTTQGLLHRGRNEPGNNDNKEVINIPKNSELEPYYGMQFRVKDILIYGGGSSLCRGCSQCILSPAGEDG